MASLKKSHASSGSSHSKAAKFKRYLPLYLMFLPGAIYLLINNYIPMAGIIVAFKKYNARLGIWKSPFCGLANFEFLFASSDAWTITRNTLLYNLAFIVLNTVVGIIFAIFICDTFNKKLKKIYQSAILFPYLMSAVILGYIVYAFLSQSTGIVNNSILSVLGKDAVNWYAEPKYWPFILIFVNTWKGVGYGCLIYISTINGIDPSLYEAASLDGATKWQQIKNITLPFLNPTVITLTLMSVGRIFYSDFGLFYQVTQGVPNSLYNVASTFDTYVYQALQSNVTLGRTAAAGLFQAACCCATVLVANFIVSKIDEESAII